MTATELFPKEKRSALFSDDRLYRYCLEIRWDCSKPLCQFIGLNPSTADEVKDDPTVRRCKAFARAWGFGGIVMTNLFAFRATDPNVMKKHHCPTGERASALTLFANRNDFWLCDAHKRCSLTVAAWGTHGAHMDRAAQVYDLIPRMKCFRKNRDGSPAHPLYIPANQQLIDFK